jgi:hypothetical protein
MALGAAPLGGAPLAAILTPPIPPSPGGGAKLLALLGVG